MVMSYNFCPGPAPRLAALWTKRCSAVCFSCLISTYFVKVTQLRMSIYPVHIFLAFIIYREKRR